MVSGRLYYPYVFPPNLSAERGSELLSRLEDVHRLRGNASQLIDAIEKDSKALGEAGQDIKDLKQLINVVLPKQTNDTVALAGVIVQANCRRLSHEVDVIRQLPLSQQGDAMMRLIDKVKRTCPRIDVDKFAQLLGLKNAIGELVNRSTKAGIDLNDTQIEKTRLENDLKSQLAKLQLNLQSPTTPDQVKESATAALAQLKAINAQFDNLVTSLIQPQPGGINPLTNYIRTERLLSALKNEPSDKKSEQSSNSYWLVLKVINAGGNNRIKTNPIVDIFTGGNRLSHSGGVIVQYHLFDENGVSMESGTVSDYTNYIKANKVRDLTGSNP